MREEGVWAWMYVICESSHAVLTFFPANSFGSMNFIFCQRFVIHLHATYSSLKKSIISRFHTHSGGSHGIYLHWTNILSVIYSAIDPEFMHPRVIIIWRTNKIPLVTWPCFACKSWLRNTFSWYNASKQLIYSDPEVNGPATTFIIIPDRTVTIFRIHPSKKC